MNISRGYDVELKQIKEMMSAMKREGIKKLSVKETSGFELTLEREGEAHSYQAAGPAPVYHSHPPIPHRHEKQGEHFSHHTSPVSASVEAAQKEEKAGKYVTSPMVGTYYSAPSPDDPPFVKVGDRVDDNTVICIIEAMKVMNEVKAGMSGVIAEIYVDNGHPLEFGTKILRIV